DTANDIRHDFDAKLDRSLAEIQSQVKTQVAALKLGGADAALAMRSRSTADFIEVALCPQKAGQVDLAASTPFEGNADCSVCIHRSVLPTLLANVELREKLAPMLAGARVINESPERASTALKISMNGDWIALDLAGGNSLAQTPSRVAATQSLMS